MPQTENKQKGLWKELKQAAQRLKHGSNVNVKQGVAAGAGSFFS